MAQSLARESRLQQNDSPTIPNLLRAYILVTYKGVGERQLRVSKNVKVANIENAATLMTVVFEEFQFSLDDFLTLHNLVSSFPN